MRYGCKFYLVCLNLEIGELVQIFSSDRAYNKTYAAQHKVK